MAESLTDQGSPDQRLVFTTGGKQRPTMKCSWDGNDRKALKEFLYQLIYHAKRPEEVDLLLEAILSIQQMPRAASNRLAEEIPIGHAT